MLVALKKGKIDYDKIEFKYKNTELCSDDIYIGDIDELITIKFKEESINNYIDNIKGPKTKELTSEKIIKFYMFIEEFNENLKNKNDKYIDVEKL